MDQAEVEIVKYVKNLQPWLYAFDKVSTFHERAAVLGISHIALEKKVNQYDQHDLKHVGLYELIMVHHGEWQPRRGEVDHVPPEQARMPLFWSFLLLDRHRSATDPEYREALSAAYNEFFQGVPIYQQYICSGSTTKMDSIPADLKIVSNIKAETFLN
ncbi:hypothetical protein KKI24_25820 [bacterium]|nr:hypothetical protein [bacterium]